SSPCLQRKRRPFLKAREREGEMRQKSQILHFPQLRQIFQHQQAERPVGQNGSFHCGVSTIDNPRTEPGTTTFKLEPRATGLALKIAGLRAMRLSVKFV